MGHLRRLSTRLGFTQPEGAEQIKRIAGLLDKNDCAMPSGMPQCIAPAKRPERLRYRLGLTLTDDASQRATAVASQLEADDSWQEICVELGLPPVQRRSRQASDRRFRPVAVKVRKRPIPRELRRAVLARDGYSCQCCRSEQRLEVDHIESEANGGQTAQANLQTLCQVCNRIKGRRRISNAALLELRAAVAV